ncbi:MAG: DUF3256 family protein [Prevotella sp.]|nr:DUF3256 family protein [Prevotellaceae bacterium]MDY3935534.1 DUF3256 family protein [Prevotella sp.]
MKRRIFILLLLCNVLLSHGQTIRELWMDMPDSLLVYLNRSLRTEMADYIEMGMPAKVKNLLGDTTTIETMTEDYLRVKLNPSSLLELKRVDAETLLCLRTWYSPEPESQLEVFNLKWERIGVATDLSPFIEKPDTMTAERYEELKQLIETKMLLLRLSPTDGTITSDYSVPLLSKSEKESIRALIKQRKFKWKDGKLKES